MQMPRLKRIVLSTLGLSVVLCLVNLAFRPFEPHHEGKPLRYWVHRTGEFGSLQFHGETGDALQAMGDKPFLGSWTNSNPRTRI